MQRNSLSSVIIGLTLLTTGCSLSSPEVSASSQYECLEGTQYDASNGAFQGNTTIEDLDLTYIQPNEMTERTLWFRYENGELEPFDAVTKFELENYGCTLN